VKRVPTVLAAITAAPLLCCAMDTSELPEVLGHLNGRPIRREELAGELAPQLAKLEFDRDAAQIRRVVRMCVDNEVYRRLIDAELKKYGITPSRAVAEEYLAGLLKLMPLSLSRANFEREISPRLETGDFQLKAAVHIYLERRFPPALLTVSPAEVARYYEYNRLRYRKPDHWDIGIIRIDRSRADAAEAAAAARARLLQGENFERVAQELDPEGAGGKLSSPEIRPLFARELAGMAPGDVSGVISSDDAYYVLLLRGREIGGMMALIEVAPFIVMEVSAAKDALALRRVLTELTAEAQISYAPL